MDFAEEVLAGNRLALSRLLTQVENQTEAGQAALDRLFPHTGRAHLVGITGASGTGKSSLVNQLTRYFRKPPEGELPRRVAIVAVDPTSPFTGGAILGDRIRMRDLSGDPDVFIRSMATRGSLGGLAAATSSIVQVFDAAGFEIILIETVGAGQAEVEIARLAYTTLVVEAPGLGDDIQAIKAGILEIADILVVNKADRPGVENTERALRGMLELAHPAPRVFHTAGRHSVAVNTSPHAPAREIWVPPIQRTIATDGTGIPELAACINRHRAHLEKSGGWDLRDRARLQAELDLVIQQTLINRWRDDLPPDRYQQILEELASRRISPHQAVKALLNGGLP